ncbi:MAG: hypothetical protein ABIR91_05335 [Candidatus Saccharimonadales bacterium]
MARLPQPGSDDGSWGGVLNDYLLQSHTLSGQLKLNIVDEPQLSTAVQSKLNAVAGPQGPAGPAGADSTVPGPQGIQGVQGAIGPQGDPGLPGADGAAGPANTLIIGTVTMGVTADATITGTAPNQTLNLTLVKGDKGDQGDPGVQGVPGSDGADGADGAPGIQGVPGAPGVDGADGAPGTTSWTGITDKPTIPVIVASLTPPASPAVGDMWVDLSA